MPNPTPIPFSEEDSLKLIQMYKNLRQKKKDGHFSYTSAMGLAAICAALKSRGFVLTDDDNTWVLYT